jgi:hypothetical protein
MKAENIQAQVRNQFLFNSGNHFCGKTKLTFQQCVLLLFIP